MVNFFDMEMDIEVGLLVIDGVYFRSGGFIKEINFDDIWYFFYEWCIILELNGVFGCCGVCGWWCC